MNTLADYIKFPQVWDERLQENNLDEPSAEEIIKIINERIASITEDRMFEIIERLWEWKIDWEYHDIEIQKRMIKSYPFEYAKALWKTWNDEIIGKVFNELFNNLLSVRNEETDEVFKKIVMWVISKMNDKSMINSFERKWILMEVIWFNIIKS